MLKKSFALLLGLLLVAFITGHLWTGNATWNFVTGQRFSPWTNYVSDYAYRSPVWPLFVGCMYGLAALLGGFSLLLFFRTSRPRAMTWLCCIALAYAGLKLCEVALFPVKPPEVSLEEIQLRMDASSWVRLKDEIYLMTSNLHGGRASARGNVHSIVGAYSSNANHLLGIQPTMIAIFVAMIGCIFLDPGAWRQGRRMAVLVLSLLLMLCSLPAFRLFGENVGLAQRTGFVGVYLWMWGLWSVLFSGKSEVEKIGQSDR